MLSHSLQFRLKKIVALALPSGINSFLDIFNIAIVLLFMGAFSDLHVLAIGVSLNYLMLFFAIHAIFYIGTNAQISRYYGAKEYYKVNAVFVSVSIGGFIIALPMVICASTMAKYFFYWIGISQETILLAQNYIDIVIYTLPVIMLKNIITSSLAGIGNTILPLLIRISSTLLSILLHYIFIFGIEKIGISGRGILGAGIANIITAYIEIIIFIIILYKKTDFLKSFYFNKRYFFKALNIGIPAGIERFLTLFSLVLTTKFIASYGDLVLVGSQIGTRIEAFSFMPGFGFMVAAMVLMGQNLGARKIKIAALYIRTILYFSSIVLGFFGVILVCFAKNLSLLFSQDSIVLQSSIYYLFAVGLSQIPMICSFVFDGALRGAGVTRITLIINATSIWLFRILPMAIIVYFRWNFLWLYVMIFLETYLRAGIFYFIFRTGIWKRTGSEV